MKTTIFGCLDEVFQEGMILYSSGSHMEETKEEVGLHPWTSGESTSTSSRAYLVVAQVLKQWMVRVLKRAGEHLRITFSTLKINAFLTVRTKTKVAVYLHRWARSHGKSQMEKKNI